MLDIKVLRENPDAARAGAVKKHMPDRAAAVDRALALDAELRAMTPRIDAMRSEQKAGGKKLGKLGPEEREAFLQTQKELKARLSVLDDEEKQLKHNLAEQLALIPNIPDPEVPDGKDDSQNTEVRKFGTVREFDFTPRPHYEIGEAQGWLDFTRAAEMAGSRNYILFGDLVLLHDAMLRFAVDLLVDRGFVPIDPPLLVRDAAMFGTGFFPGGEEQTYRCEKDGLNLIGTSEVPVTSLHAGEILCEKDTRGLYRVHQFHKVEQVIVDIASKERSLEHHESIVKNAEALLQACELPYRVVNVCGGDLGVPQAMKYDIETWMPSRESYSETHSASRFYDYQSRRLNIRYRPVGGKPLFCHTLNNTVAASPRILIPMLENHQNADGTINVPERLRHYLGGREVLGKPVF
ncbi:MAG: seryl-tRNA synthetase [Planctomycetota bacterium]|jgi:seryl-tRNA synthetase